MEEEEWFCLVIQSLKIFNNGAKFIILHFNLSRTNLYYTGQIMNFVQRLKKHEGFRKEMYTDSVGVKTIGYGFNLETIALPRPV
jgi:predicted GIY-YIG superfamily endonuclease